MSWHSKACGPICGLVLVCTAIGPTFAAEATLGYELIKRGLFATQGDADHPRKMKVTQTVVSDSFAGYDSIALVALYYRQTRSESELEMEASARAATGSVRASAVLVKGDGSGDYALGRVKTRKDSNDEHLGIRVVDLPVVLESGDTIEWTLRLRKMSALTDGEESEVGVGIGDPAIADGD